MKVQEHPEYGKYQRDARLVAACQEAVAQWTASGETIVAPDGVRWTPQTARDFVGEMARLFRQYNLVLWQSFDYCRRCGGGCCVPGASQVTAFDALALALTAQPFPHLPERAAAEACIYLGAQGCRWPQGWRPIKCWAFYCLGSGSWEIDAGDARYAEITEALATVLARYLPATLRGAVAGEPEALRRFLTDPIAFAESLGEILFELFVAPLSSRFQIGEPGLLQASEAAEEADDRALERALAFIATAVEEIWQKEAGAETNDSPQSLQDLEQLEGILLQRPANARGQLQALYHRALDDCREGTGGGEADFARQMSAVLHDLLEAGPF